VYMLGNWYGCCCVVFLDFSVEAIEGRVSVMVAAVIGAEDAYCIEQKEHFEVPRASSNT
jgi:hypothetical protein